MGSTFSYLFIFTLRFQLAVTRRLRTLKFVFLFIYNNIEKKLVRVRNNSAFDLIALTISPVEPQAPASIVWVGPSDFALTVS